MKPPKETLRSWRVLILRSRAIPLGVIKAPDERTAEVEAAKLFGLSDEQAQAAGGAGGGVTDTDMDTLERFPLVWCDTCGKTQPIVFDVMQANDKNDHDATDIVCAECKSVIAHALSAKKGFARSWHRET
jgi:hypothetical protein